MSSPRGRLSETSATPELMCYAAELNFQYNSSSNRVENRLYDKYPSFED